MRFLFNYGTAVKVFFNIGGLVPFTEEKAYETEMGLHPTLDAVFRFSCHWTLKGDHAGFEISFELGRLFFMATVHDRRHWSWEKDRWYLPGEEQAEMDEEEEAE